MLRSIAITAAAAFAAAAIAIPAPGVAGNDCGNVETKFLTATQLKIRGGLECQIAQKVLRFYFKKVVKTGQEPNGCAQKRLTKGCRIGAFRCFTRFISNETVGHCDSGKLSVRFKEVARGPT